jgi:hypothetical protein
MIFWEIQYYEYYQSSMKIKKKILKTKKNFKYRAKNLCKWFHNRKNRKSWKPVVVFWQDFGEGYLVKHLTKKLQWRKSKLKISEIMANASKSLHLIYKFKIIKLTNVWKRGIKNDRVRKLQKLFLYTKTCLDCMF